MISGECHQIALVILRVQCKIKNMLMFKNQHFYLEQFAILLTK